IMPSRPNKDMARAKECTIAHRVVVTDERTLGGWSSPRTTKQIPATKADNPAQRMRLDAVTFISLSSLRRLCSGDLRSYICLLHLLLSDSFLRLDHDLGFIARERSYGLLLLAPPSSRRLHIMLEHVVPRHHERNQHDAQKTVNQRLCPSEAYVRMQTTGKQ